MEFSFTFFPKATAFFKPTKCTLYDPTFGQHFELVEFISLYHLNGSSMYLRYCMSELFTGVSSINEEIIYGGKVLQMKTDHFLSTFSIRNIRTSYMDSVGQPKCINNNMQFYSGYLFPRYTFEQGNPARICNEYTPAEYFGILTGSGGDILSPQAEVPFFYPCYFITPFVFWIDFKQLLINPDGKYSTRPCR